MKPGQTLEVIADCATFATDVKEWSQKANHPLISCNTVGKETSGYSYISFVKVIHI
jgi:TusA-related sulfurtransferase